MKKEGIVGLVLIAAVIVIAVVFFRPKGLEDALGGGFQAADVTKIGVSLRPVTPEQDEESLYVEIPAGSEEFAKFIALLDDPHYSRTNAGKSGQEITLPYEVRIAFATEEAWAWQYEFFGGKLVYAGPSAKTKAYQITGGQETQEKILDFLLELEPAAQ